MCLECVQKRQSERQSTHVRYTLTKVRNDLATLDTLSSSNQSEYERYRKLITDPPEEFISRRNGWLQAMSMEENYQNSVNFLGLLYSARKKC